MAVSAGSINFKTSPSGLVVPTTASNVPLDAVDVTHELVGPGDATKFLSGTNPPSWATPVSDPAADTKVWMPLVDSDGTVVLDSHGVIPTLITL